MKKIIFTLLLTVFTAAVVYSQAGVYLYIPTITTGAGSSGVHIDEAILNSYQFGIGANVTPSQPPQVSQPVISDVTITKGFDLASLRLQSSLLKGTQQSYAEIRFYNSQNVIVFSIRLEDAYLSGASASSDGTGCPSGCQSISESYAITATGKVIQRNLAVTPNQVLTYDIQHNATTFTQ